LSFDVGVSIQDFSFFLLQTEDSIRRRYALLEAPLFNRISARFDFLLATVSDQYFIFAMANFSKPQNMTTMLFALFAFLQFTVALQHGTHHKHARHSADAVIKAQIDEIADSLVARQSSGYTAITGVCSTSTGSNGVCNSNGRVSAPRLEIRQLRQNADQWNLYLLGMERFMAKDKNDRLSYYQVVGVHGRPYTTWNNFPTPLLNNAGFCPHAQTLFGSWHRPYLAIFEVGILSFFF
jgi:tyrosinase